MKKTRLIEVLRSFEKKELRELKKWLHSPMHNQREDVRLLYAYLIDGKRLEKDHLLDREKVFKAIYAGEDYDDAKMRQVGHFFMKTLEACKMHEKAVLVGRGLDIFPRRDDRLTGSIDIWWERQDGGLMILLAQLLKRKKTLATCLILLFLVELKLLLQ